MDRDFFDLLTIADLGQLFNGTEVAILTQGTGLMVSSFSLSGGWWLSRCRWVPIGTIFASTSWLLSLT